MAAIPGHRVVVFLQENKTTDFYFPSLAEWGAAVANQGKLLVAPPNFDQPHDRNAWCISLWATTRRFPCRSTTTA
jgi:hypothetical protein